MTAKTDLELQNERLLRDEASTLEEAEGEFYYFYDNPENQWQLREENGDMSSEVHSDLVDYLIQLLRWLFRHENYIIHREMNFYETRNRMERPLYPDVFVRKAPKGKKLTSYRLGLNWPPPELIFEVISEDNPQNDLEKKPPRYEKWGVQEYFVYDPRERIYKQKEPRLWGWRLVEGKFVELAKDEHGRLWSEQLQSWLVENQDSMLLYDAAGNLRLTEAQAEGVARRVETAARYEAERQTLEAEQRTAAETAQKEAAMRQAEAATKQAKSEKAQKEAALRQTEAAMRQTEAAETERQRALQQAEAAIQREQALLEKLRKANINLDDL